MSLFQELKRRNVIRVAMAYAVVAWLLVEIASVIFESFEAPVWAIKLFISFVMLGFPLALFFAWAFEMTPEGLKKEKDVDRSQSITTQTGRKIDYIIIGVLSVALIFFISTHRWGDEEDEADSVVVEEVAESGEQSIAVLPFTDMSADGDQEYFGDGIAEELLNVLVRIEGLRVASRTSSFSFKNKDVSIPGIAKELDVDHVLEGSIRKAGNKVRVTAQLIDVRTDSHLWSATYDRELEDIFAIQDEISGHIVQALKVALGTGREEVVADAQQPTQNLEAYEHYLRGRYFWQRRGEDNIRHAIDLFEQATELDPKFARAWSSLAAAHTTLPTYSDAPGDVQYPLAVSAARKALSLDDTLAEAHAVLGDMARDERNWAEAKAHYLHAIASEPKNSTAHLWYAEHLASVGQLHEAQKENLIAYELDPLHPGTNANMAQVALWLGDLDDALKYAVSASELGHFFGLRVQALVYLQLGEQERALEFAEQFESVIRIPGFKLFVEAKLDAEKIPLYLEVLAENETELPISIVISSYVAVDRVDEAYRMADKIEDFFYPNATWNFWRPEMTVFRQDPRFAELVMELGLMDYWRENGWPDACKPVGDSLSCQ